MTKTGGGEAVTGLWVYYCPFAYFVKSRLKTRVRFLSWLFIYPLPILLGCWLFNSGMSFDDLISVSMAVIATYSLYELGYLQNDSVTIENERSPTLRLTGPEISLVKRLRVSILIVRLGISLFFLWMIYHLGQSGFSAFLLTLVIIAVVFPVYNRTRGKINMPLHFILVCCRFCGPALLVYPAPMFLFYLVLAFPILNLIERSAEPRYDIKWIRWAPFVTLSNQHSGRPIYYLLACFAWLAICLVVPIDLLTGLLFVYFFLYRLLSPVLLDSIR